MDDKIAKTMLAIDFYKELSIAETIDYLCESFYKVMKAHNIEESDVIAGSLIAILKTIVGRLGYDIFDGGTTDAKESKG